MGPSAAVQLKLEEPWTGDRAGTPWACGSSWVRGARSTSVSADSRTRGLPIRLTCPAPSRSGWRCCFGRQEVPTPRPRTPPSWPDGAARWPPRTGAGSSPTSRPGFCFRTSPVCQRWSIWPRCARPWPGVVATPRESTLSWTPIWSSTTRSRSTPTAARARTRPTWTGNTSATTSATACCAGPNRPSTASGWCPPGWGSATRSTSSTWGRWCDSGIGAGPSWRTPTAWLGPTPTPPWSTPWASSAGGWAGSRQRPPCSVSRCCSPRRWWSGSASPAGCSRGPPPLTWSCG